MLDGLASPRGRLLRRGGLSEARPSRVLGRHGFHRQLKLPSSLKDDSRQVANATSGEEAQVQPMLRLATSRRACMTALTASAATWTLGGGGGGAASGATTTTTISVGQLVECVELPLTWDGSSYLVNFWLQPSRDEPFEPFTAALDTGSPFLTVLREGQRNCEAFGCFSGEGVNSGLESTYEQYGLQRDEVTDWLLGAVSFGAPRGFDSEPGWTYTKFIFAASSHVMAGNYSGGATPLFGLVKDRCDDIRPTLLEQAGVDAFAVNLARSPRSGESYLRLFRGSNALASYILNQSGWRERTFSLPLVDLRPLGAPVRHHAFLVHRLTVNGREVNVESRPIFAILDTGTTGILVSRGLYEEAGFDKGFVSANVEVLAGKAGVLEANGGSDVATMSDDDNVAMDAEPATYDQLVSIHEDKRAARQRELAALAAAAEINGRSSTESAVPAPAPNDSDKTILTLESDIRRCRLPDCLLISSPIDVPWWESGRYDVMFLGLAFMKDLEQVAVNFSNDTILLTRRADV